MAEPRPCPEPLSARIHRLRLARGWSQARLAAAAGVSPMAVMHWERGDAQPQVACFAALAQALEVSMDDLWSGGDRCQR